MVETGDDTMTGGRLKRVRKYVGDETFCLTYGDGVSDVHIGELVAFHKRQGTYATLTAVQPTGRFGTFSLFAGESLVRGFKEKPAGDGAWVNGGFFVCEPAVFDYVESDATVWENEPLERLSREGQLSAFRHQGFWQSMDTLRDRLLLEALWNSPQSAVEGLVTEIADRTAPASSSRARCRGCGAALHHVFVDLGYSPMANDFLAAEQLQAKERVYPLCVYVCERCLLVQLEQFEAPDAIFNADYAYFSSFSESWVQHARDYADVMVRRFRLDTSHRVVEIASNDGYLLQWFHQRGIPVLGSLSRPFRQYSAGCG